MTLQARAYAKINLGLYVLRRRIDGYHDIRTVFHRIDLFDSLTFEESQDISLRSASTTIPLGSENLCCRAALKLSEALGVRSGVTITLDKMIPVGAGLGGGSSDAAATLTTLPRLWNVSASRGLLHDVAMTLGSDVPYFLNDGTALGEGRGELLDYFSLPLPYTILVCNPGIHVSTAWAFSQIHTAAWRAIPDLKRVLLEEWCSTGGRHPSLENDFEEPVFAKYPLIGSLKQEMLSEGAATALMSGSGSTVFGLFADPGSAKTLAGKFSQRGYTVSITEPWFSPESITRFASNPQPR